MAVGLRGSITTTTTAGAGSASIAVPAGVVAGDVLVIWATSGGGTAACAGFTALNTANLVGEALLWRTADGTEGTTLTVSGLVAASALACAAISGAAGGASTWDPATPAAATAATASGASPSFAGLENSSSKATVVDGDMLLWLVIGYNTGSTTQTVTSPPAGFAGTQVTVNAGGSTRYMAALYYKAQTTHGTTGTQAGTLTSASGGQWTGNLVALRAGAVIVTVTGTATITCGPVTMAAVGSTSGAAACTRKAWLTLGALSVDLEDLAAGYVCSSLDLGYPTVRDVVTNNPDAGGAVDRTQYLGPRTINVDVEAVAGAGARLDEVAASFAPFMDPSQRPTLTYVLDRGTNPSRQMTVRAAGYSWPVAGGYQRSIQLQFVAADPIAYDPAVQAALAIPATPATLAVGGDLPARPRLRITGPVTHPQVTLTPTVGLAWTLAFLASFTIAAGHYVDVDTAARTVVLDGDPAKPRLASVDWTVSSWQWLPPDTSVVLALAGTSTSAATQVTATWQDAYLT